MKYPTCASASEHCSQVLDRVMFSRGSAHTWASGVLRLRPQQAAVRLASREPGTLLDSVGVCVRGRVARHGEGGQPTTLNATVDVPALTQLARLADLEPFALPSTSLTLRHQSQEESHDFVASAHVNGLYADSDGWQKVAPTLILLCC